MWRQLEVVAVITVQGLAYAALMLSMKVIFTVLQFPYPLFVSATNSSVGFLHAVLLGGSAYKGRENHNTAGAVQHDFWHLLRLRHDSQEDQELHGTRAQHPSNTSTRRTRIQHLNNEERPKGSSSNDEEDSSADGDDTAPEAASCGYVSFSSFEYTYNRLTYDLRTTVLVVLANFLVSMFVSTSVKMLYVAHEFKYPLFITSLHMLFSFVLSAICVALVQEDKLPGARAQRAAINEGRAQEQEDEQNNTPRSSTSSVEEHEQPLTMSEKANAYVRTCARVAPFCVMGALSIACGNVALLYLYPSLHQILQNTTPFWSVLCATSFMSKRYNLVAYLALVPVCAGGALAAWGEQSSRSAENNFVWAGVIVSLICAFLRALKAALQGILIDGTNEHHKLDPIGLLFYSSPLSLILFLLASSYYEGGRPWAEVTNLRASGALWLVGSASFAAMFNLLAFLLIGRVGPTTTMVVGNLKTPATALLSVVMFHNTVTPWQVLAFFIVSAGCFLFTAFGRQVNEITSDEQEERGARAAESPKTRDEVRQGFATCRVSHRDSASLIDVAGQEAAHLIPAQADAAKEELQHNCRSRSGREYYGKTPLREENDNGNKPSNARRNGGNKHGDDARLNSDSRELENRKLPVVSGIPRAGAGRGGSGPTSGNDTSCTESTAATAFSDADETAVPKSSRSLLPCSYNTLGKQHGGALASANPNTVEETQEAWWWSASASPLSTSPAPSDTEAEAVASICRNDKSNSIQLQRGPSGSTVRTPAPPPDLAWVAGIFGAANIGLSNTAVSILDPIAYGMLMKNLLLSDVIVFFALDSCAADEHDDAASASTQPAEVEDRTNGGHASTTTLRTCAPVEDTVGNYGAGKRAVEEKPGSHFLFPWYSLPHSKRVACQFALIISGAVGSAAYVVQHTQTAHTFSQSASSAADATPQRLALFGVSCCAAALFFSSMRDAFRQYTLQSETKRPPAGLAFFLSLLSTGKNRSNNTAPITLSPLEYSAQACNIQFLCLCICALVVEGPLPWRIFFHSISHAIEKVSLFAVSAYWKIWNIFPPALAFTSKGNLDQAGGDVLWEAKTHRAPQFPMMFQEEQKLSVDSGAASSAVVPSDHVVGSYPLAMMIFVCSLLGFAVTLATAELAKLTDAVSQACYRYANFLFLAIFAFCIFGTTMTALQITFSAIMLFGVCWFALDFEHTPSTSEDQHVRRAKPVPAPSWLQLGISLTISTTALALLSRHTEIIRQAQEPPAPNGSESEPTRRHSDSGTGLAFQHLEERDHVNDEDNEIKKFCRGCDLQTMRKFYGHDFKFHSHYAAAVDCLAAFHKLPKALEGKEIAGKDASNSFFSDFHRDGLQVANSSLKDERRTGRQELHYHVEADGDSLQGQQDSGALDVPDYYVTHGTYLGYLRHGSIIPYDPDVDVVASDGFLARLVDFGLQSGLGEKTADVKFLQDEQNESTGRGDNTTKDHRKMDLQLPAGTAENLVVQIPGTRIALTYVIPKASANRERLFVLESSNERSGTSGSTARREIGPALLPLGRSSALLRKDGSEHRPSADALEWRDEQEHTMNKAAVMVNNLLKQTKDAKYLLCVSNRFWQALGGDARRFPLDAEGDGEYCRSKMGIAARLLGVVDGSRNGPATEGARGTTGDGTVVTRHTYDPFTGYEAQRRFAYGGPNLVQLDLYRYVPAYPCGCRGLYSCSEFSDRGAEVGVSLQRYGDPNYFTCKIIQISLPQL